MTPMRDRRCARHVQPYPTGAPGGRSLTCASAHLKDSAARKPLGSGASAEGFSPMIAMPGRIMFSRLSGTLSAAALFAAWTSGGRRSCARSAAITPRKAASCSRV